MELRASKGKRTFTKLRPSFGPVCFLTTLQSCLEDIDRFVLDKNISLELAFDDGDFFVKKDKLSLYKILFYLVINFIDFSKCHSRFTVSVKPLVDNIEMEICFDSKLEPSDEGRLLEEIELALENGLNSKIVKTAKSSNYFLLIPRI